MEFVALTFAIGSGLAGALFTRASRGFTRWGYGLAAVASYAAATALMAWLVQRLPVGLVYAVWTGAAAVILVIVDRVLFGVRSRPLQLVGMAVTLLGIAILGVGMSR